MELKQYEKFVNDFWNPTPGYTAQEGKLDLAVAGLGLAGEAGEALEYLKKYCAGRHKNLKTQELFDELGDVMYYLTRVLSYTDSSLEELMIHNTLKLGVRFEKDVSGYLI